MGDVSQEVIAKPNPGPQTKLVTCPVYEIFYGGSRGGGKTFGLILKAVNHISKWGDKSRVILFRKSYDELDEVLLTAKAILIPLGAEYRAGARTFILPNGGTLKLRHLSLNQDADKYQGHQYTLVMFDELPNWADPEPIDKLRATCRSAAGVRCQFIATGNPGGVGHNWVKSRYIDPAPAMQVYTDPESGLDRVFIPSSLKDNQPLVKNDPQYVNRLKQSGPDWLVRAWLNGDWNIVAGGMFDDIWSVCAKHSVIRPFIIPRSWRIDRSFDSGFAHPFSVGWWAESDGTIATLPTGDTFWVPRGSLVRIAEWYGSSGKHNSGLNLLPREIASGIKERESLLLAGICRHHTHFNAGPADSEIWNADKGVRVADEMMRAPNYIKFVPADKTPGSRVTGWQRMRSMMKATTDTPREEPGLYIFDTCREWLRTVPNLPRDSKDLEDVNTSAEDHIADETRYRILQVRKSATVTKLTGL